MLEKSETNNYIQTELRKHQTHPPLTTSLFSLVYKSYFKFICEVREKAPGGNHETLTLLIILSNFGHDI